MLASDVAAVALVEGARVAVVGTRRTVRLLGVGRAGGARAGAGLGRVALARRGTAHGPRVARRVLASAVAAVALVEGARVAVVATCRPARLLGIGWTSAARAGAGLGKVALARSRAAHGPRVPRRV